MMWWGGPPGPRGSPWTRILPADQAYRAPKKPTGASAADQGVRPTTKSMWHWAPSLLCRHPRRHSFGRRALCRPLAGIRIGCGYAALYYDSSIPSRAAAIFNPGGVKESSPRRKPWESGGIRPAPEGRKIARRVNPFACSGRFFRPAGACIILVLARGLRHGLLPFTLRG